LDGRGVIRTASSGDVPARVPSRCDHSEPVDPRR
jgi:hypothetical protein